MLIALLTTNSLYAKDWISSLNKHPEIKYDIINISAHDWQDICLIKDYDLYILRVPGDTNHLKQMFDERAWILANDLQKPIYPSLDEILIYENKKYLSYWLKAHDYPCPETNVFYTKKDALEYIEDTTFPIVSKINIGASGKGVRILYKKSETIRQIEKAFSKGIRPYIGPNFRIASIKTKLRNMLMNRELLHQRMGSYISTYKEPQKYLILQEYIRHNYEWRVVVIGDSFFAHKKMVTGDKASGSLQKDYGNPPLSLMDFVRGIIIKEKLESSAWDIFETEKGYLINEIQTYFGQSDAFQMKVDGVIGRYRYLDDQWIFEPGDFASNQCYDLRVKYIIDRIGKSNIND